MKKNLFSFLISFSLLFSTNIYSQPLDTIRLKIDSIANIYLSNQYNAGLMIGIYRPRTNPNVPVPPEFYSYGEVKKGTGIRPDTLTLFKLGSVGKTFTATALAYYLIHQPNYVKLANHINNYFPAGQRLPFWDTIALPNDTFRIKLIDLATHYSALPHQPPANFVPPPNYIIDSLMNFLGSDLVHYHVRPLPFQPGTQWQYSNTGFGTLGVVMERISGMTYDSMLIKIFCDSLKMNDTRVFLDSNQLTRLAVGYDSSGATHFALGTSPGFYGAGGNYSTMSDMIKYLAWNMGFTNTSLNNLLDTLHFVRNYAFGDTTAWQGLAWQINYLRHGFPKKYIWKDGQTTGYTSFVCWVKETNTGVVVMSNSSNAVDPVGIDILRVLNPILTSIGISNISNEVPEKFSLYQNYPNPFNPVTKIKFDVPAERIGNSFYRLFVYDALGKQVSTLVNEKLSPGSYEVEFNGQDFSSGIYYYKLYSENFSQIKKMVLLK